MKRKKAIYWILALFVLIALLLLAHQKCTPSKPLDDGSLPSAAILGMAIDQHDSGKMVFSLDFILFRDSENVETSLGKKHFTIDSLQQRRTWLHFKPIKIRKQKLGAPQSYSALMLMDQSGSITSSDRDDYRLDAAKQFVQRMGENNEIALWRFPAYRLVRGGNPNYQELVPLSSDTSLLMREIDTLSGTVRGGTPMFVAQEAALAYLNSNAQNPINALLTFTDGHSTGKNRKDSVIHHALAHDIKLINIGLGKPDTETLLHQAMATNGAYLYAKDSQQLISFYGNLDKLISNNARYYHTQWEVTSAGEPASGKSSHQLQIRFPSGEEIEVPFMLFFDRPLSSGNPTN